MEKKGIKKESEENGLQWNPLSYIKSSVVAFLHREAGEHRCKVVKRPGRGRKVDEGTPAMSLTLPHHFHTAKPIT